MKDDLDLVHGSGNVFRDFGHPDADLEQAKAILAARIIEVMDARGWTARAAEKETGVAHADLSRIRNVRLDRFTLDRLVTILGWFDQEVTINVRPRPAPVLRPARFKPSLPPSRRSPPPAPTPVPSARGRGAAG